MRLPTFEQDEWRLDSGEDRHADAPTTFWIPSRAVRESLAPGVLAKLIFEFTDGNEHEPEFSVERMWVLVTEKIGDFYLGLLANEPATIEAEEKFYLRWGSEVPFRAEHVIDVESADDTLITNLAAAAPERRWPRT